MNPLFLIPQALITLYTNGLTQEQRKKYEAAVDQQIREGRAARDAQISAMMSMIEANPHTEAARQVLDFQRQNSLAQIPATDAFNAAREHDVMGYLEGIGTQSKKDIERTFGEESGAAQSQLVERGLSGGGVGASIAHGFATRKADALARENERVGELKATTLSGLRSDTQMARERALDRAYGAGSQYGDFQSGWGQYGTDTFADLTNRGIEDIYGIQHVPPDTSANNAAFQNLGGLAGRMWG